MPKTTKTGLDELEAEVLAGQSADGDGLPEDTVTVPLGDEQVRVLPTRKWRSSGLRALRAGDFEGWAEKCLAADDYDQVWLRLDPDLEQVNDFFVAWRAATGQDLGK